MTSFILNKEDGYKGEVTSGVHSYYVDEPKSIGGTDEYGSPIDYLLGSLASCTALTLRMYAERKEWDLGQIKVEVNLQNRVEEGKKTYHIEKNISFENQALEDSQVKRLLKISEKCPVSQILEGQVNMVQKIR